MSTIAITDGKVERILNERTVAKLQVCVDRTNNAMRAHLTPVEWIHLHLCETAIADDLSAASAIINQIEDASLNDRKAKHALAKRDELLADLEGEPGDGD